ncbi:MAG TPA: hypothetical protein VF691_13680 [Cytophagaceae bacterium]
MRQTAQYIKRYFTVWWIPIVGNLIAVGIFVMGTVFKRDWIIDLALIVLYLSIILTIISSIVQLVNRKWYFIFPQLGVAAFLFYYTTIIFTYSPPDYYGANKEIPKNIDFLEPLDSAPTTRDFEINDLILTNGGQPGIYKYYTDYKTKETGYFYIKAFEITSNYRLSDERMKEMSKIRIDNLKSQQVDGEFTIYEGDWGDKYGSRIELWFQPSKGREFKIEEKNYIIEGWQR